MAVKTKKTKVPKTGCINPYCRITNPTTKRIGDYCSAKCYYFIYFRNIKAKVFLMFDPHPRCVCCGNDDIDILALNHKDNDGHKDRKENKSGSGSVLYGKIFNGERSTKGLEIVCANCNNKLQTWAEFKTPEEIKKALRLKHRLDVIKPALKEFSYELMVS